MHLIPKFVLPAAMVFALAQASSASVVISFFADRLDNQNGTPLTAGTLIQLVNLGADGIFNPIDIGDGSANGLARWTSGDDTVLDLVFKVDEIVGDFASTAAFDLRHSSIVEDNSGQADRKFEIAVATAGIKLGIRWFPGLTAAQYYSGQGITLAVNQPFGQFTRQEGAKFGGQLWVMPADGGSIQLDPLLTADGIALGDPTADLATAGDASFKVIETPEPAVVGLSLIGAAGLAMLRRRRHA